MPIEMTEHVCEENIEESYESFDISESDLIKARPQPIQPSTSNNNNNMNSALRFLDQQQERSMIEKLSESFFNQGNKVALNSDVDLIKTTKTPFIRNSPVDDKIGKKNY
jgi:hypothetical protein